MISSPNIVGLRTSTAASRTISNLVLLGEIAVGDVTHAVLHHHDGTIDHEAKVDGPQAEQAGGDAESQHSREGEQHRKRDRQGNDACRPQVAQEGKEHDNDQQAALEQVVPHGADDVFDQFGAVVNGLDLHIRGERGFDLLQAAFEVPGDFMTVLARQHETQAKNHLAPAVCRDGPSSNLVSDLHVGHVLHPNGHALLGRHHDVPDLLDVGGPADAVDQEHLAVLANVAAADVAVVSLDGLHDLVEGQAVLDEPGRVDPHLILLFVAAPGVDFGSALGGPQFRLDDPIVDGAKLRNIVALAGHDVVEDLAQPRRYRPQLGTFDAGRYLRRCPVVH